MTLTDSEIRSLRIKLSSYTLDQLTVIAAAKSQQMQKCLETCPDIMDDDCAIVQNYHRFKTCYNAVMEEHERRRTGESIESLPGMEPITSSTHTMIGR